MVAATIVSNATQHHALVSRVFSCFLGDTQSTLKSAARVARAMEEQFIIDGWPLGRNYGSETELVQRYGIGRVSMREAIRILEARGTARNRRGKRGGVELTSPSLDHLCERVISYCLLSGVTREQVRTFQEVLHRVDACRQAEGAADNAVIEFYKHCTQQLEQVSETQLRDVEPRNFAEHIVKDLFQRVGSQHWSEGIFLGNEGELCERYQVDQRTLRQAIRILESAEAAVSIPGRGNGLMARAPGPTSISRLTCCYFAANGVDHHEAYQSYRWLSLEAMRLAACRSNEQSLIPINAMLMDLDELTEMELFQALIAIEDRQLTLAGNIVLDLFLRSCKAFPSWSPFVRTAFKAPLVGDLFECVVHVQAAMAAHDPLAAVLAQERKFKAIHSEYSQWLKSH